ncbi:SDR family oxidoreductase [Halogeometricum borinquense]|uniref:SDR family oxidoreductase n=1 Tax=Halogeometricum borinquense TaxID=60847 RepID=A0A6C0UPW5_9EURY|nr:SDR family oxidoreductase [Halogeometricum borinquense]QIB74998.1 SDR family oxidoreductase [Halogeometricum borinquense]QIQ76024.1 SDR family oxidoreductase [Halogeometricum borinquense]
MNVEFDFDGRVALVTGACGALGSAVAAAFRDAGATVAAADIVEPDDEDSLLDVDEGVQFYHGNFTDEDDVSHTVESVIEDHGRIDFLANIAGTWRGGDPIHETDADTFDLLFDVNLKTMFLASKHALPHLQETEGAIVSVSARSSLEGGEGDGVYRASKAGVRLLTETIATENLGTVRANAVMPSVIDTPMNREMMPDADHDAWVDPAEIARTVLALCSDATGVTSGAAVPVYGEA